MVQYEEPLPWGRSSATEAVLKGLVSDGLLPPNSDPSRPVWIAPRAEESEPKPPSGYIVRLVRLHERGFSVPAGRFVRALCAHYGVELHNFAPNSIPQAAVFVALCEGFLGVEVHWDLWVHLFRGELYTDSVQGQPRRYARAGGLMLHVRGQSANLYNPSRLTTNNAGWTRGWFYLRNDDERLPAFTDCNTLI